MGKFLKKAGEFGKQVLGSLNEQLGVGENTPRSLDTPDSNDPNRTIPYGALGDFASKIDPTAQRSYVESGYISNVKPRSFEFLMQEPDVTIVIKKRMFSSLNDNYQMDKMDSADRNFIRASKRLFQNKCQAISIYERLTKIERAIVNKGAMDDYFTPLLVSGIEALDAFGVNIVDQETKDVLGQVRKLQAFSEPSQFTSWIVDPQSPYDFGEGTGVFELTLVSSLSTKAGLALGSGDGSSLTIEDPYRMMNITNQDVEKAISDIYNPTKNTQLFQFSEEELAKQNTRLINELNTLRRRRGAANIIIKVSDNSILFKRVRAIVDEIGKDIIFSYNAGFIGIGSSVDLDGPANEDLGSNGLNATEEDLFKTVINNTYTQINLRKSQEVDVVADDELKNEVNYVREKMRLNYLNKHIIQVMDSVHVYISSKTQVDNKITGIDSSTMLSNGSNLLQQLNTSVKNLEQSFNNVKGFFGGADPASSVELEKAAIVGPDFPTWLWVTMRNDFTRQAAGTHVFAGLVNGVTENYSDGKYTLNVSMRDNSSYFDKGITNIKPSVDVRDREIYDPLTPFKLDFDASTGFMLGETPELLQENIELLATGDVKFKNGSRFLGSVMSKFLYGISDFSSQEDSAPRNVQKIFYDPDGFVYRWKSGIGTHTFSGPRHPSKRNAEMASPSLSKNVFAGQDVMNVLSLLVTGIPYNYNTFMTSAIKSGNLALNDKNPNGQNSVDNVDVAVSFFRGFISDLQKNNLTWGNFIPFKKLIISEKGLEFLVSGQFSIQKNNAELSRLLDTRSKIFDSLTLVGSEYANNPNLFGPDANNTPSPRVADGLESLSVNTEVAVAINKIEELDRKINDQKAMISAALNSSNTGTGEIQIFGDDISFDPTLTNLSTEAGERDRERAGLELRKQLNRYTQRRLWRVKANEDMNLFIVDDQYDKDYDIQAFEKALAGKMELLKSDYTNVSDRIREVSKILGLEIFANTQGHIQVKPPGYNKMPSSVFQRMIAGKNRLFPKQLESLFLNQADGLIDQLEIIEDELRLRTTALGYDTDESAKDFIRGNNKQYFQFVTQEDGTFGGRPYTIRNLVSQDSPDAQEDKLKQPLKTMSRSFSAVEGQAKLKGIFFDTNRQSEVVFDKARIGQISASTNDKYEIIRDRLRIKKGQNIPTERELFSNARDGGKFRTQSDILKVTREISKFISERQGLVKTLNNAIKNIDDGKILNDPNNSKSKKSALFPSLYNETDIPSVLEHMIEDETIDDLGPGSGGRYIIKENQIKSMQIGEKEPDFTSIEVNGLFGEGYVPTASNLNFTSSVPGGGGGGNAVTSATAVDYDLWRMYGFKASSAVSANFISDPDGQAAPLANWLLTEQRRKIISGTVTIIGNEYMQPGEVVYIEDRDLLFYVESVSHSFSYGSDFSTTLTLTYGHNPGEYFPTMLDIVGKGLYSKRHQANLVRHIRHGNSQGYEHLGALMVSGNINDLPLDRLIKGKYGEKNRKILTNMLITLKSTETQDVIPNIEIRVYKNKDKNSPDKSTTDSLKKIGEEVINWLKNPTKRGFGPGSQGDSQGGLFTGQPLTQQLGQSITGSTNPDPQQEGLKLSNDIINTVKVIEVDTDDPRSPSGQAWLIARDVAANPNENGFSPESFLSGVANAVTANPFKKEDTTKKTDKASDNNLCAANIAPAAQALHNSVLDIWIKFSPSPSVLLDGETLKRIGEASGQAGQEAALKASEAELERHDPLNRYEDIDAL